ncbi:hypothetical protein EW026_g855 [Hermanssonia centrifuga]|uniref:PUL domain-containing protein n=1 Tax=Hermanssonia centrifuga TaxID=98765 RepID=A0A4S4KV52_9APHY|nr:hypothetical protein EW026_g855 [Hermanssonia centrifuga]
MKGTNAAEFESQVSFLLWETYPPHPHTLISTPALDSVTTDPILFTQVPALDVVLSKLTSFIDNASPPIPSSPLIKQTLSGMVIPYFKARFPATSNNKAPKGPSATPQLLTKWTEITRTLTNALPAAQLFPLVDLWRLALLDEVVGSWCASSSGGTSDLIRIILTKALSSLSSPSDPSTTRNYILTTLRMLSNVFVTALLARDLLSGVGKRNSVTALLVASLLHQDAAVRTAAASLAFNVSAFVQKGRLEQVRNKYGPFAGAEEDGEWEVEFLSAVLEALQNETQSEDIVHRLTVSLAFIVRFSPVYDTHLSALLEVLQVKETLKAKLAKGGCGADGIKSPSLRKLIEQVADKLC